MKNPLLKLYLFANGSKTISLSPSERVVCNCHSELVSESLSVCLRKVGRRCYADNQAISWIASPSFAMAEINTLSCMCHVILSEAKYLVLYSFRLTPHLNPLPKERKTNINQPYCTQFHSTHFASSVQLVSLGDEQLFPLLGERDRVRGRIEHIKLEILKQLTAIPTHMDSHVSPQLNCSLCKV